MSSLFRLWDLVMERPAVTSRVWGQVALVAIVIGALGFGGCASYMGTTAASFMKNAQSPDPNVRHAAYAKLASPNCYDDENQKGEAATMLAKKLSAGREPIASRAVLCRTLGELHRPEGREALIKAAEDEESIVRAEACRALGVVGKSEDAVVLSRHMTADTDFDCKIAAIDGLGKLKSVDPLVQVALVDGMEHEQPGIRVASYRALQSITSQDFGPDPAKWRKYAESKLPQTAAKPESDSATTAKTK
jgi:HEAT repeat protein